MDDTNDTNSFYNDILGYDVPESVYWTFNNLLLDDKLTTKSLNGISVLTQRRPYKVQKSFPAETLHLIRDSVPNWHVQLWVLVMYFNYTFEKLEEYTISGVHSAYQYECTKDKDCKKFPKDVRENLGVGIW